MSARPLQVGFSRFASRLRRIPPRARVTGLILLVLLSLGMPQMRTLHTARATSSDPSGEYPIHWRSMPTVVSFGLANVLSRLGLYESATSAYDLSVASDADYALAYFARGENYEWLGEPNLALSDYNRAIELYPQAAEGYVRRGTIYHRQGEFDAALDDFNRAIEVDPDYVNAWIERGNLYRDMGLPDSALDDLNHALAVDPLNPWAIVWRACTYEWKGEKERALADYRRFLELYRGNEAWNNYVTQRILALGGTVP